VAKDGFSSAASRQTLGSNYAPLQRILRVLFPEEKRPGEKMIIHLSSADDNELGYATEPCEFMEGKGKLRFFQNCYIKTGSNFVIRFIIFLEIILKSIGV
jgi:hypothetical protein